jgi:hypothetical protein
LTIAMGFLFVGAQVLKILVAAWLQDASLNMNT